MNLLTITRLDPLKHPLVTRFYKTHYPSAKAKRDEATYVGYYQHQLVAALRLRQLENCRLLTGMVVAESYRGQGFAHQLIRYCQQQTLDQTDYCFAYPHLTHFYAQYGFAVIDVEQLPETLKNLFIRYINSGKNLIPMHYLTDGHAIPRDF